MTSDPPISTAWAATRAALRDLAAETDDGRLALILLAADGLADDRTCTEHTAGVLLALAGRVARATRRTLAFADEHAVERSPAMAGYVARQLVRDAALALAVAGELARRAASAQDGAR